MSYFFLTFLHFSLNPDYSRYNYSLFPSDVSFECNACGFKIPTLTDYIKNYISDGDIEDTKIILTNEEKEKINNLINVYITEEVDKTSLTIIADTIGFFGKDSRIRLGSLLNDFKKNSGNQTFDKTPPFTFDKNDFNTLIHNIENLKETNEIAKYIINYEENCRNNNQ